MIEIEKPRIERVEASDSYGKFVVEPLEHGFGQTLGNSLRRVLLSSLPGVAVSSIRIEGIQHEFSAVPGVKEDVAEIILNLKELSAKLYCDGPKTVSINVKGPCELTAAALAVDDQIEVVNRDLHIATLNEDADLIMHLTLEKGRGYVSAANNKNPNTPIGVIPTDSIFTPIRKVNYTVENTRVGQETDYDRLTLEVWTMNPTPMENGAINHFALDSTDIEASFAEAQKLGLNFVEGSIQHIDTFWSNGIRYFNVLGPNHEVIEFCQIM